MAVLDDIIVGVRDDLRARQERIGLDQLQELVGAALPALDPMPRFAADELAVIAEVKRASPSKGALADITDPAALAAEYASGGASAISVLTEQRRFSGSLADLDAVRRRVSVPVLRKDFVVTDYQVYEARAHGADLVLLIVAALDDQQLQHLHSLIGDLGMTALVEVHTAEEAHRAAGCGATLIGVNNRNLRTLEVDLGQFGRLVEHLGDDVIKVAESGIVTPADVAVVAGQGADVILVGEALVRHATPGRAIAEFTEAARGVAASATRSTSST